VELLAAVGTAWQGDFGGMRVLPDHKKGEYTKVEGRPWKWRKNKFSGE